jgi:hypothetical protein
MDRGVDPLSGPQVASYLDCVEVTMGLVPRVRPQDRDQLIAVCDRFLALVRDTAGRDGVAGHIRRRIAVLETELAEITDEADRV